MPNPKKKPTKTELLEAYKWIEEVYKPWYAEATQPQTQDDSGGNPTGNPPPPPPGPIKP